MFDFSCIVFCTAKNMKFSVNDFIIRCEKVQFSVDFFTLTKEILKRELNFLCSLCFRTLAQNSGYLINSCPDLAQCIGIKLDNKPKIGIIVLNKCLENMKYQDYNYYRCLV